MPISCFFFCCFTRKLLVSRVETEFILDAWMHLVFCNFDFSSWHLGTFADILSSLTEPCWFVGWYLVLPTRRMGVFLKRSRPKVLDDDFVRSPLSCLECILEAFVVRVNRPPYEIHPLECWNNAHLETEPPLSSPSFTVTPSQPRAVGGKKNHHGRHAVAHAESPSFIDVALWHAGLPNPGGPLTLRSVEGTWGSRWSNTKMPCLARRMSATSGPFAGACGPRVIGFSWILLWQMRRCLWLLNSS